MPTAMSASVPTTATRIGTRATSAWEVAAIQNTCLADVEGRWRPAQKYEDRGGRNGEPPRNHVKGDENTFDNGDP